MDRDFDQERKNVINGVHDIFDGLFKNYDTEFIVGPEWHEADFRLNDNQHELQIHLNDKFDVVLMSYISGDHNRQVSIFTDRTDDLLLSLKAAKEKYLSIQ